ncbi:hypothetical protein FSP39_010833 [Pinctada imbricata]|uniref:Caveolin n=1 Tax=Pinctada imbricata TaxID=66713 RepID=A0AA88YC78_PINIB|nr:hypothetical protein FSP39_010833 [Pinctada imbricata]
MCIALQWGCEFALVSFNMVWYFTPALRMCSIYAGCCQKFYGTCMMCCLAPLCESLGLFFSRITVTNKSG